MRGCTANGPNIRRRRRRLGLTQEELASHAEVDVKTIRNAEANRKLDADTLQRIALALSVELSYIAVTSSDSDHQAEHRIRVIENWLDAFNHQDVDRMIAIYHDDAELTCPSDDMTPAGGTHKGKESIRRQALECFAVFKTEPMTRQSFRIHCAGDFVFLRGRETVTVRRNGVSFSGELLHEFEFNDAKVTRHKVLFDTASRAKGLQDESSDVDDIERESR